MSGSRPMIEREIGAAQARLTSLETEMEMVRERTHVMAQATQQVIGKLEGHEKVCLERWTTANRVMTEVKNSMNWGIWLLVLQLLAVVGFFLRREIGG